MVNDKYLAIAAGFEEPAVLEQVDLTPTLALGLGLPISKNSVGNLIPAVFEELSLREQLRILQINGHQLSRLLQDSSPVFHKGEFTCVEQRQCMKQHPHITMIGPQTM